MQHKSNAGYQFKLIRSNGAMGMGSNASCKLLPFAVVLSRKMLTCLEARRQDLAWCIGRCTSWMSMNSICLITRVICCVPGKTCFYHLFRLAKQFEKAIAVGIIGRQLCVAVQWSHCDWTGKRACTECSCFTIHKQLLVKYNSEECCTFEEDLLN